MARGSLNQEVIIPSLSKKIEINLLLRDFYIPNVLQSALNKKNKGADHATETTSCTISKTRCRAC